MNQIDSIIEEPVACPYIGLADGARPTSTVGDAANRCHAGSESATIDLSFQEEYCFTSQYPTCERYRPLLQVEAVAARPGLSVEAALAAEAEALAEATSHTSISATPAADAEEIGPPEVEVRPAARAGRKTSSGLVGVFATPDSTAGPASTSAPPPFELQPVSKELLGSEPFAVAPIAEHRTPTPPPTAWKTETTASVMASILPPFTLLSAGREAAPVARPTAVDPTSIASPAIELPSVIEAGPPITAADALEPSTAVTALAATSAYALASEQPSATVTDPRRTTTDLRPAAATAAVLITAPEASTSATVATLAPDTVVPVAEAAQAPLAASGPVPPAVAIVSVGPWPKETIDQPDYIQTRGSDSTRPSMLRRVLLVLLVLAVAIALIALFFAAASGSLDRFLPAGSNLNHVARGLAVWLGL